MDGLEAPAPQVETPQAPKVEAAEVPKNEGDAPPAVEPKDPPRWDGRLRLKVDGKEEDLDLNDESARKRLAATIQIDRSASDKHRRAAEAVKLIENFAKTLKSDPYRAFQELGLDPNELDTAFETRYLERREREKMPESERRAQELAEENQRLKETIAERQRELEERGQSEQKSRIQSQLENALVQVIDKSDLPKDDPEELLEHFQMIGSILQEHWNDGYPMRPDEALAIYQSKYKSQVGRRVKKSSAQELVEQLGPEKIREIQEFMAKKAAPAPEKTIPKDEQRRGALKQEAGEVIGPAEARRRAMAAFGIKT